jgi:NAD(P)-dependent dehydrogenase (short-subunit alcohol dehydrogenase family)
VKSDLLGGQVALVTGAGGEIGAEMVRTLLEAGACVAGVVRRSRPAVPPPNRQRFLLVRADVRSETAVRRAVRSTLDRFGQIDILVNNAGARGPTVPITSLSLNAWREVVETNLTGPFLFARECLKVMTSRRYGRVINVASVVARWAYPLRAPYAASKAALLSLTWTLAQEAGAHHILVNAICPGPVEGRAVENVLAARARRLGISARAMRQRFLRPAALGRMATVEDVSRAVLFLCSDAARNITGQVIDVSAGYGLYPGI